MNFIDCGAFGRAQGAQEDYGRFTTSRALASFPLNILERSSMNDDQPFKSLQYRILLDESEEKEFLIFMTLVKENAFQS
jgi:hypothetical protein